MELETECALKADFWLMYKFWNVALHLNYKAMMIRLALCKVQWRCFMFPIPFHHPTFSYIYTCTWESMVLIARSYRSTVIIVSVYNLWSNSCHIHWLIIHMHAEHWTTSCFMPYRGKASVVYLKLLSPKLNLNNLHSKLTRHWFFYGIIVLNCSFFAYVQLP